MEELQSQLAECRAQGDVKAEVRLNEKVEKQQHKLEEAEEMLALDAVAGEVETLLSLSLPLSLFLPLSLSLSRWRAGGGY